uniref:Uncharacterized protein n=1 Tax=Anopheles farauti TaxID=69004 RepID=A0A182R0L2_9DIPT
MHLRSSRQEFLRTVSAPSVLLEKAMILELMKPSTNRTLEIIEVLHESMELWANPRQYLFVAKFVYHGGTTFDSLSKLMMSLIAAKIVIVCVPIDLISPFVPAMERTANRSKR